MNKMKKTVILTIIIVAAVFPLAFYLQKEKGLMDIRETTDQEEAASTDNKSTVPKQNPEESLSEKISVGTENPAALAAPRNVTCEDGIYREGVVPSVERQNAFLGQYSMMTEVIRYTAYEGDLYGITQEEEAILVDMGFKEADEAGWKKVVIPTEIEEYPVTEIREYGLDLLFTDEIILPDSVQRVSGEVIGEYSLSMALIPEDVDIAVSYRIRRDKDSGLYPDVGVPSMWGESMIQEDMLIINDYLYYCTSKEKVIYIPEGVKTIAPGAFQACYAAETVILPESVEQIYSVPHTVKNMNIPKGVMRIMLDGEEKKSPWFQDKIQQSKEGMVVINGILLYSENGKTEVTVPEGVWSLSGTFWKQKNLQKVTIPDGVTEIGNCTFAECQGLEKVNLPDTLIEIGANAFIECRSLKQLTMGNAVRTIGDWAFAKCTSMEMIVLSDSIREIPNGCFLDCGMLRDIHIPDGVRSVSYCAFSDCVSLRELQLPDSLQYIGSCAFEGCVSLETITLPEHLEYIGGAAFANTQGLRHVVFKKDTAYMEDGVFAYHEYMSEKSLQVRENIVVELSETLPERLASQTKRNEISDGAKWFYDTFGLENCTDMMFVVQKGSAAEALVKEYRMQDGKEMYQYRYYGE